MPKSSTWYEPATGRPSNSVSDAVSLSEKASVNTRRPMRDRNGVT